LGYDIHITRKSEWSDEVGANIAELEWFSLIKNDPELQLVSEARTPLPDGEILVAKDPTMAVWKVYSKHDIDGNMAWFWLWSGNIVAKNPDKEILVKLYQISQVLGAKVQGDDGEIYDFNGDMIIKQETTKSNWWKFWN